MHRVTITLILLCGAVLAGCGPDLATPQNPPASTGDLPQAEANPSPPPPDAEFVPPNVSFEEVSLFADSAVVASVDTVTAPAQAEGPNVQPESVQFTFNGWPGGGFRPATVNVYRVDAWGEILPEGVDLLGPVRTAIDRQATLGTQGTALDVPGVNAASVFAAQVRYLEFASGSGVRYVTQLSQAPVPTSSFDLLYVFQGFTSDGQYYVRALLPLNSELLPETGELPPEFADFDAFGAGFVEYVQRIEVQLNDAGPATFTPPLTVVDELVQSIRVGEPAE